LVAVVAAMAVAADLQALQAVPYESFGGQAARSHQTQHDNKERDMTTISTRKSHWAIDQAATAAYHNALASFKDKYDQEMDELTDHISDFLEMRLDAEFTELREDIDRALAQDELVARLMAENTRFRDEITALSMENLRLSAATDHHVTVTVKVDSTYVEETSEALRAAQEQLDLVQATWARLTAQ
jgi:uncharacterized protein YukE